MRAEPALGSILYCFLHLYTLNFKRERQKDKNTERQKDNQTKKYNNLCRSLHQGGDSHPFVNLTSSIKKNEKITKRQKDKKTTKQQQKIQTNKKLCRSLHQGRLPSHLSVFKFVSFNKKRQRVKMTKRQKDNQTKKQPASSKGDSHSHLSVSIC